MPPALERARLGTYARGTGLLAKRARWVWAALTSVGMLCALPVEAISTWWEDLPALLVLRRRESCEQTEAQDNRVLQQATCLALGEDRPERFHSSMKKHTADTPCWKTHPQMQKAC